MATEWTREQRYQPYEAYEPMMLTQLAEQVANSQFRQNYHIQPKTGLLNDPNGFSYFNGAYHLFYQWFPMGPVHGVKCWGHLTSVDLITWEDQGIALAPDSPYDSHGVYSGSGQVVGEQLYLMYTGNVRGADWQRTPHQIMAIMDKDGNIQKQLPPVIEGQVTGYTDHFRDPKMWQVADDYYAVIGAQRENQTGTSVLYHSTDALNWSLVGEIQTQLPEFGYMWECPDYFELSGQGILLFSPQGLTAQGIKYNNLYQTGYLVGEPLDLETAVFSHGAFQELDAGFDFYATQTTLAPDGRRLMFAWMGLPEIAYPSDRDNWAHCLTLPRELTLSKENRLLQKPARELTALRQKAEPLRTSGTTNQKLDWQGTSYELVVKLQSTAGKFGLILRGNGEQGTYLYVDRTTNQLVLDRSNSGEPFGEAYGTIRRVDYNRDQIQFQIFVDQSSIEIFVNEGETTFTTRIFTAENQQELYLISEEGLTHLEGTKWTLGKS